MTISTSFALARRERVDLNPALAHLLVTRYAYPYQRTLNPVRVSVLGQERERGAYRPDTLSFALLDDQEWMMDGYHRCHLTMALDQSLGEHDLKYYQCRDMQEVGLLYNTFDQPFSTRSAVAMMKGLGCEEQWDLSATFAARIKAAGLLIYAGMQTRSHGYQSVLHKAPSFRAPLISRWVPYFRQFQEAIRERGQEVVNHPYDRCSLAVGLLSFRYAPNEAARYWSAAAKHNHLAANSPEMRCFNTWQKHQLLKPAEILQRHIGCWNAFYEGRTLHNAVGVSRRAFPYIAGTPFNGREECPIDYKVDLL